MKKGKRKIRFRGYSGFHLTVFIMLQLLIISIAGYGLTITKTIVVSSGQTYDGGGKTIYAQGMGDGSQDEGQDPIFKLERGANLKNVRIGAPGCDGVHCYGNNRVENVIWEDVGEDALTVKGSTSSDVGTVTVTGGAAYDAADKVFQINAPCTFRVSNFTAQNFGKVVRQNGGTTFKVTIYLEDSTFSNGGECIARTDSSSTQLYYSHLNVSNVPTLWIFPSSSQIHGDSSSTPAPTATPGPTAGPINVQPGVTATIQAEDCFISNGDLESIHSGYSGIGYVNFVNQSGGYIEWTVSITSSSQAECRVFFANGGTGGRPCEIRVNNNVVISNLNFPQTSGWSNWSSVTASINLNSGANVIRLTGTGSEGGPNVDRIEITPGNSATPVPTNPPTPAPTTPPSQGLLGDVDGDGVVTITDALLIARYYVDMNPSPFNINVADTNCDNNVDILDALLIAQYYVGLISSFC